jgi:hypothetical protein
VDLEGSNNCYDDKKKIKEKGRDLGRNSVDQDTKERKY